MYLYEVYMVITILKAALIWSIYGKYNIKKQHWYEVYIVIMYSLSNWKLGFYGI